MRYSPDEIKALGLMYGSYRAAAKKTGVPVVSLTDAANADIKGKVYRLSDKNYDKIFSHVRRLGAAKKGELKIWERLLDSTSDHPNVKRAFMSRQAHPDRGYVFDQYRKYGRRLDDKAFWSKIMSKLYDKYHWQKGKFSK